MHLLQRCVRYIYIIYSLVKKHLLMKEHPPPSFGPISFIGSKLTSGVSFAWSLRSTASSVMHTEADWVTIRATQVGVPCGHELTLGPKNVVVFTRVSHGTLQAVYGRLTCSIIHYSFHHRQTLPITSVISVCTQEADWVTTGLHMWEYCVDMKSPLVPKCCSLH